MAFSPLTSVTVLKIWVTRWCKWLAPHIKDSNGTACCSESSWQVRENLERSWKDEEWTLSLSTWVSMGGTEVEQRGSWRTRWRIFIPCHDGKQCSSNINYKFTVFSLAVQDNGGCGKRGVCLKGGRKRLKEAFKKGGESRDVVWLRGGGQWQWGRAGGGTDSNAEVSLGVSWLEGSGVGTSEGQTDLFEHALRT